MAGPSPQPGTEATAVRPPAPPEHAVTPPAPLPAGGLELVQLSTPGPRAARRAVNGPRLPPPPEVRALVRRDLRAGGAGASAVALGGVAGALPLTGARWGVLVLAALAVLCAAGRLLRGHRPLTRRTLVVGGPEDVATYISSVRESEVEVVGSVVLDGTSHEHVAETVALTDASMVLVLPGPTVDPETVRRLTWSLEHVPARVCVLTPVAAVSPHRLRTGDLLGRTVVEVRPAGASPAQARAKAVVDRVTAALLLVLAGPVLLLLVLAIRLDSSGPGLFLQTRVGRHGELFRMVKLRTMHVDAEAMREALLEDNESDGVLFKIRRDPRVTRLGYWLRRLSLDELPQLVNVARGEMSLVGPRPALPSEVEAYDSDARRRLVVKPGITGLWQVSGRSDLLWDEALRLDLHYADNWRLVDDLRIAFRTVGAVTRGRGAY